MPYLTKRQSDNAVLCGAILTFIAFAAACKEVKLLRKPDFNPIQKYVLYMRHKL